MIKESVSFHSIVHEAGSSLTFFCFCCEMRSFTWKWRRRKANSKNFYFECFISSNFSSRKNRDRTHFFKVNQNFNQFQIGCYRSESNIYLRINQIMKICVLLNQINIIEDDQSVKTNNKNLNQVQKVVIIDASKLVNYI